MYLTRNQAYRKVPRVRIPLSPPVEPALIQGGKTPKSPDFTPKSGLFCCRFTNQRVSETSENTQNVLGAISTSFDNNQVRQFAAANRPKRHASTSRSRQHGSYGCRQLAP